MPAVIRRFMGRPPELDDSAVAPPPGTEVYGAVLRLGVVVLFMPPRGRRKAVGATR
jgi:hypothetical protein